jgi:acylphosphatase
MTADRATTEPVTRRCLFFGRVQGVGFRYTSAGVARDGGLCGYVKNRPNGSVELVAQGTEGQIEQLLARLDEHFAGYIERQTIENVDGGERFSSFDVRR